MTMTTPSNPNANQPPGLTPEVLVNQLFDAALMQSASKNPHEISQQVIDFLGGSLVYALTSSKRDIADFLVETLNFVLVSQKRDAVVFLTETLVNVIVASATDEQARKELLKHVGDTIANAGAGAVAAARKP